jgi:7-cyano-7-deazaguanine synthase
MGKHAHAIVLLSGGMDSAVTLALAKARGFQPLCLSFDYGQRHRFELKAARAVAKSQRVAPPKVIAIDLAAFGGSALTADVPVPKNRKMAAGRIPVTYVPARNTVFLSYALAYLDAAGADSIFIGVNALDYSGYPDCRPEYIRAFAKMANLATRRGVAGHRKIRIEAPLIRMTKAEIVRTGTRLGVDFSKTFSCYDPDAKGRACGACDACRLRKKGFAAAGIPDPTRYRP